jgi:signal transduction histidine kinase
VITGKGLWRVGNSEGATRVVECGEIQVALLNRDGSGTILRTDGVVSGFAGGSLREIFRIAWRPIDMVRHGETIWVSYDGGLVGLREGRPPEVLGRDQGIPSGGPLLVDREGSLWMGTFRGLLQFPAPETVSWGMEEGLPGTAPRRLALTPEGIWVDTWSGLFRMRPAAGSWKVEPVPRTGTGAICADTGGSLFTGSRDRVLVRRAGESREFPVPGLAETYSCAAGAAGRMWLATNLGLFVVAGGNAGSAPRRVPDPPGIHPGEERAHVLEDAEGRVWIAEGETVCSADAGSPGSEGQPSWSCGRAEGAGQVFSLIQVASGELWAATLRSGILRLGADGKWAPIPGSRRLPGQTVRALRPSRVGGVWIVSYGTILRVVERRESPDGWEVVERPSPWQGLMISDAEDLLEEPDGDLWIATLAGLVHIPAGVRRSAPPIPSVELVDVRLDGERLDWNRGITLPYHRSRIDLRFAALSFRDPSRIRYQMRLREGAPWRDAIGGPSFQLVDLPPGRYHPEVRATLDGIRWSPAAAGVSFAVRPPFWRTGWFATLAAAALGSAAYVFYRYRLSHLLRLERVRTRIAADLHDDIGASLSRIALQAELLRRDEAPRSPPADRLLSEMGESARELVDPMSDIVWSVDPRRDDLASLVARSREFALGVLEPRGIALDFRAPTDAMEIRLSPERRRHLYLILKEAVSNAARHAGAGQVWIQLERGGGELRLEVRDDGQGLRAPADPGAERAPRGGRGLPNLKSRAEQMGGTLEVISSPGGGTTLRLLLPLGHSGA